MQREHYVDSSLVPSIVSYIQENFAGIQQYNFSRQCIGYVMSGTKYLYNGDSRQVAEEGDMFYLGSGLHYTENIPAAGRPYEQIVFYFTPESLNRALSRLSVDYGMEIRDNHSCAHCKENGYVIYKAGKTARNFFNSVSNFLKEGVLGNNPVADSIKMTEMVYFTLTDPNCCLKRRLLEHTDSAQSNFEQVVRANIFTDLTLDQMAALCSCCTSTFKKEFKKLFLEPPHQWFIKQRLMHARLLLISTGMSISQICNQCAIPNTSHFIKLFKREYGLTPAIYRRKYNEEVQQWDESTDETTAKASERSKKTPVRS